MQGGTFSQVSVANQWKLGEMTTQSGSVIGGNQIEADTYSNVMKMKDRVGVNVSGDVKWLSGGAMIVGVSRNMGVASGRRGLIVGSGKWLGKGEVMNVSGNVEISGKMRVTTWNGTLADEANSSEAFSISLSSISNTGSST